MKINIELVCWLGPLHTFTPLSHTHLPKEIVGEAKVYLHPPRIDPESRWAKKKGT